MLLGLALGAALGAGPSAPLTDVGDPKLEGIALEVAYGGDESAVLYGMAAEVAYLVPPQPVRVTYLWAGLLGAFSSESHARITNLYLSWFGFDKIKTARITFLHVQILRKVVPQVPVDDCPTTPYECVEVEPPPYECVIVPPMVCVGLAPEVRIIPEELCPPIEGEPLPGSDTPPEESPPAPEIITIESPMSPIMQVGDVYMLTVRVVGGPEESPTPLAGRTVEFASSDVLVASVAAVGITDANGYATVAVIGNGVGIFTITTECEGVVGESITGTVVAVAPPTVVGIASVSIGLTVAGVGSVTGLPPGTGATTIGFTSAGIGTVSPPSPAGFGGVSIGFTSEGAGTFIPQTLPPPEISGTGSVSIGVTVDGAGSFTPLVPGTGNVRIGLTVEGVGTVTDPPAYGAVSIGLSVSGTGSFTPPTPPIITVASVVVSPCPSSGFVGSTLVLSANPLDAQGNHVVGVGMQWSTSNPAVATVSSDDGSESHRATVTFVGAGSCIITAISTGP